MSRLASGILRSRALAAHPIEVLERRAYLSFGALGAGTEQVILSEHWNSGAIDATKWQVWGSPSPSIYPGPSALDGGSFISNGDGWHESGVVSRDLIDIVPGLRISFRSILHADGGSSSNPWQFNGVLLSTAELSSFHDDTPYYSGVFGPQIQQHGGPGESRTQFRTDRLHAIDSSATFGKWVDFAIQFNSDGAVSYFQNGQLVAVSEAGWIDYATAPDVRLVVAGRSSETKNLIDDIKVSQVPVEKVLLSEDWNSGATVDAAKWQAWGSPSPSIYTGASALDGRSFISNGDGWHESGVVSQDTIQVVPGLRVSFRSMLHADGGSSSNAWQFNGVLLSTAELSSFGENTAYYSGVFGPQIQHHGGPGESRTQFRTEALQSVDSAVTFGKWVDFAFQFNGDGSVSYFQDAQLVAKSKPAWIDYDTAPDVRLVVAGRSSGTKNLVDEIKVSQVPVEQMVLSENWNASASIDSSKWQAWGSPSPSTYTGASALGGRSFISNGDSNYESGVVSRDLIEIVPGLRVSFRSILHADGGSSSNPWQFNGVLLSTADLASFGNSTAYYSAAFGPYIQQHGGPGESKTQFRTEAIQSVDSVATFGKWVDFTFQFNDDASVSYLQDGQLVAKSKSGWINYATAPDVRLVVAGRSAGTNNLVDDIVVSRVPQPLATPWLVTATGAADSVGLSWVGNAYRLNINGDISYRDAATVSSIEIHLLGGNDLLLNAATPATVYGGAGQDTLKGGIARDTIYAGFGHDSIVGMEGDDVIDAGEGDDTVFSGPGADNLVLGGGSDLARSGRDNDSIWAGAGLDVVVGDNGDDLIYGEDDADTINGGDGNDSLYGNTGMDRLIGVGGNDLMYGGADRDQLMGGFDNDSMFGGAGDDTLKGGVGNDTLDGGVGSDTMLGEAGDDWIYSAADNARDLVRGDAGSDHLRRDIFDQVLDAIEDNLLV